MTDDQFPNEPPWEESPDGAPEGMAGGAPDAGPLVAGPADRPHGFQIRNLPQIRLAGALLGGVPILLVALVAVGALRPPLSQVGVLIAATIAATVAGWLFAPRAIRGSPLDAFVAGGFRFGLAATLITTILTPALFDWLDGKPADQVLRTLAAGPIALVFVGPLVLPFAMMFGIAWVYVLRRVTRNVPALFNASGSATAFWRSRL